MHNFGGNVNNIHPNVSHMPSPNTTTTNYHPPPILQITNNNHQKGIKPNTPDHFGCPPLHYAALAGNLTAAQASFCLLERFF
jgi:ankyrin repeat protein